MKCQNFLRKTLPIFGRLTLLYWLILKRRMKKVMKQFQVYDCPDGSVFVIRRNPKRL